MSKTILVLAANPKNTSQLRLDQEVREIGNGLERAKKRDEFSLKQKLATRPIDVRRAMLDYKPQIVHFCGHGVGEEGLLFEDENGQAKLISTEALSGFFELFADGIECVVLNACYSEVQADAIARFIPYVIGMSKAIGDAAAVEFAVAFYDALGAGKSIDFAYKLACNSVQMAGIPEHLTPKLKGTAIKLSEFSVVPRLEPEPLLVNPGQSNSLYSRHNAERIDSPIQVDFINIPAGEFWMGSDDSGIDPDAMFDEFPRHQVFVSNFYVSRYPVTNAQYAAFVNGNDALTPQHWKNGKMPEGKAQHPVVRISWHDAKRFCDWLSKVLGETFRLPTEAEWEKAARGTDGRIFPWGNQWDPSRLNCRESKTTTTPVGQYSPQGDSFYGISDMSGNVWEWCADWSDVKEYSRRLNVVSQNPHGPASGSERILRGGSFSDGQRNVRCAYRNRSMPTERNINFGFRIVYEKSSKGDRL